MPLEEYRRKRHFNKTPEPPAEAPRKSRAKSAKGRSFVVQKHAASRLHYDFRLEHDGVLLSWAVPKGPSLDPAQKRLAVHVEDHPLAYANFEGVIPAGEYGGGSVIVWDRGTYEPEGDMAEMLASGRMKFRLDGEKLSGSWNLVRTGGRSAEGKNWLLIKSRDDAAVPLAKGDVLAARPESVVSGRTVEEVADQPKRVWKGGKSQAVKAAKKKAAKKAAKTARPRSSHRRTRQGSVAKAAAFPETMSPQLATLAKNAPEGDEWLHEIKYDGYRLLARIDDGDVTLFTRAGNDWTARFSAIVKSLASLRCRTAWIDGEAAAQGKDGITSFSEMQTAMATGSTGQLVYFVFDLLYLDGVDLRATSVVERKRQLKDLLAKSQKRVQFAEHVVGNGPAFFKAGCQAGLEGIISKRADAAYQTGRTKSWLKVKCGQSDEFLVGGFTLGAGSRTGFGALLLGERNDAGELIYTGRVGTGFDERTLIDLRRRLDPLQRKTPPFSKKPAGAGKDVRWTEPVLLIEVEYAERTADGLLRQARYRGLRDDKSPSPEGSNVKTSRKTSSRSTDNRSKAKSRSLKKAAKKATSKAVISDEHLASLEGVRMTNPDRVLYPDMGVTKLDLAAYHTAVADWILPEVINRPLALVRCPEGTSGECFFQKHSDRATPEAIERVMIEGDEKPQLVIRDLAGLLSLVQMGVLEIHPWGSRVDRPERPDRMTFDLDPGEGVGWREVVSAALLVRSRLDAAGLESFVKTTGGKGLHVVLPLARRDDWDDVKGFARRFAERLASDHPQQYIAKSAKAARRGKIYVDYLRNGRGATAIAAYSPRARAGATVATPLAWEELTPKLDPQDFTIETVPDRLTSLAADPWADMSDVRQSLTAKVKKTVGL